MAILKNSVSVTARKSQIRGSEEEGLQRSYEKRS
jgi:hypothetical protein